MRLKNILCFLGFHKKIMRGEYHYDGLVRFICSRCKKIRKTIPLDDAGLEPMILSWIKTCSKDRDRENPTTYIEFGTFNKEGIL